MALFIAWLVVPLVLVALSLGCGLLVERAAGLTLPGALLLPLGLALVIVEADLVTMTSATAQLATPLAVALAVAGYGLAGRRGRRVDGWALGCGVGVFAVYAAPIVLSGQATFAGYITLDDTSTWLALTDRAMEHGRTRGRPRPVHVPAGVDGLLHTSGYPLGAFMPLGIGGKLTGQDIAWLFQPTIALLAVMLALSLYTLSARLVSSRPLRAVVAFLGAQPALLFAYSLWSGIKELAAAALIALVCAAVAATIGRWQSLRATAPAAVAVAALFAVLSPAGGVWLVAPALVVIALLIRRGAVVIGKSGGHSRGLDRGSVDSVDLDCPLVHQRRERRRNHIEHGSRQPRTPAGQPPGLRDLAGDRLPQPSAQLVADERADRRSAPGGRGEPPVRLAPTSVGDAALPRHRRWRHPAALRPRTRRPELAVAECEGDGGGVTGAGRRRGRRRSSALRDGTTHRGGGHRRCDRRRRPVVERARVLECLAGAAGHSWPSCRQSAIASPDRARR